MRLLDQDHPDWRGQGRGNRTLAVHAILKATLDLSVAFALQFDRSRLAAAVGDEALATLMPGLAASPEAPAHLYEIYRDTLDGERRRLLRRVLSPSITDPRTGALPLSSVRSARGRDATGATTLRVGDGGGTIVFELPSEAFDALVVEYELARIPTTVLAEIDLDVEALEP